MTSFHVTVGARIKNFRKIRRLSQTVVGQRIGVSYQAVQGWEKGEGISVEMVPKIAAALEVKPIDLLFPGELPEPVKIMPSDEEILERIRAGLKALDAAKIDE